MIKKERKPRSPKSFDLCPYCGCPNCNPMWTTGNVGIGMRKIIKRLSEGLCMGCGKKECKCKSHKNENKIIKKGKKTL